MAIATCEEAPFHAKAAKKHNSINCAGFIEAFWTPFYLDFCNPEKSSNFVKLKQQEYERICSDHLYSVEGSVGIGTA